jgi:uptake hydrogenase small subunit
VPRDMPSGVDKTSYVRTSALAKTMAPRWTEEDIFVV